MDISLLQALVAVRDEALILVRTSRRAAPPIPPVAITPESRAC
jgi:hypothetical protein